MVTLNNPFALLEQEDVVPIQKVKEIKGSNTDGKKIPFKAPLSSGTPIQKKTGKTVVKDGQFEEKPEHAQVAGGKEQFRHKPTQPRVSGKKDNSDKKEVAGKGNWGSEVEAQLEATPDDVEEYDESGEPIPDPELSYKSLADYQAEKEATRLANKVKIRQVETDPKWAKLAPLTKEDDISDLMFLGKGKKEKKPKEKVVIKTLIEIEQTFTPEPRFSERSDRGKPRGGAISGRGNGRGGAGFAGNGARGGSANRGADRGGPGGGRGNGRGGRGRGGSRSGKVNFNDTKDFPTLSSSGA